MTQTEISQLQGIAVRVRRHAVSMASKGGCFLGAALSCVELMTYMYYNFLRIDPSDPHKNDRDYLLLSNGHDVPTLYGVLAERGFFDASRLANHLSIKDDIYWHPNPNIPGVEFHSGSLGHLLAVGVGIALDAKIRRNGSRVVVMVGDGELNEGSNWEALLNAQAYKLDNLLLVVDRNGIQANMRTEELIPLEPLADKLRAFGCAVRECDGHDYSDIESTLGDFPFEPEKPNALVAHTVRGKGVVSIEDRVDKWFCKVDAEEERALLQELNYNGALQ